MRIVSKKKFFPLKSNNGRACALAASGGTCAQGPDCGRWNEVSKKIFFLKSRIILAHAHWRRRGDVRAGLPNRGRWKSFKKKNFFRKKGKCSRMRNGGAGGTCAQGPDCGSWKNFEKKQNFRNPCRKILAHAHWRRRGMMRAGPGTRKMEKF